jgi:hypothetical protein
MGNEWRDIRAMRAEPPGLVAGDEGRRLVFSAALQQAEELHQAAAHTGFASRPLPLFYALSQGGRAIAAARSQRAWKIKGHGMKCTSGSSVLEAKLMVTRQGAVPTVSRATGSAGFNAPVKLGTLLASLPEVADRAAARVNAAAAIPLHLDDTAARNERYLQLSPPLGFSAIYFGPEGALPPAEQQEGLKRALAPYPRARGWQSHSAWVTKDGSRGIGLSWPIEENGVRGYRALELVATRLGDLYYLRPGLGASGAEINLLMTWWAVLLGLSSLARYEPASWRAGLDSDTSVIASLLEETLDQAQKRVPELIRSALVEA